MNDEITVAVGTANKVKIKAVQESFEICFPKARKKIVSVKIKSIVSSMPLTEVELIKGAKFRAESAYEKIIKMNNQNNSKFIGIGMEGGIYLNEILNKHFLCGWVAVKDENDIYYAKTSSIVLPDHILKEIQKGFELGPIIDRLTGKQNTKEENGAFGFFTKNIIQRKNAFIQSLCLALAPIYNKKVYASI